MGFRQIIQFILVSCLLMVLFPNQSDARNPIRRSLFNRYPVLEDTQLDNLPSNTSHCGACHFDFDGGGARNPYGLSIEVRLNAGLSNDESVADVEFEDADNDGFSNYLELTDLTNFGNTPTFPGLTDANVASALNVDQADLVGYLTPSGGSDITPPVVNVVYPVGGESWNPNETVTVQWVATDESGISHVDLFLSDDGGLNFRQLAGAVAPTGSYDLFIPNLPGTDNRLQVVAYDNAFNPGSSMSAASFTIASFVGGIVPTTLRDFDMPGTNPFEGGVLEDPSQTCIACHGNFDPEIEPYHNWQGSMMAQAMTDPLFLATMVVAEEFVPGAGDLCLRCHTPGGWQEGRSFDTTGGMLESVDIAGVQCDFCHRMVDNHYVEGVSPAVDEGILADLAHPPTTYANGQFVTDPTPVKRGPYDDAQASHQVYQSDFTLSSNLCGTCHDVSNPAFVAGGEPGYYEVQALDTEHPDGDRRNMFPVERTFSEWTVSEYAAGGVYQPQFAGNKPDGMVSTCQDCHMRDVEGVGSNIPGSPSRQDIGLHDLTGGNTFVPDIIPDFFPEVDVAALQAGKLRAESMLSLAATMDLSHDAVEGYPAVIVRVTNETGHKLPSGYPEGRRTWLNIKAYDSGSNLVYESGAYDPATGILTEDDDAKIYRIKPGFSRRMAEILGLPYGPSFHFALNDTIFSDNRIPPRGATNAALASVQSPVVAYTYEDGQYWDDTQYVLPMSAVSVEVTFYYQTTSKGYIEFLRDSNHTNSMGQDLYNSWVNHGRSAPVAMAQQIALLDLTGIDDGDELPQVTSMAQNYPNSFNPQTWIEFSLPENGRASLKIYNERGSMVRTLVDESHLNSGPHRIVWDGRDDAGREVSSGSYHYILKTDKGNLNKKMMLIR
jgi:hypothetical protein